MSENETFEVGFTIELPKSVIEELIDDLDFEYTREEVIDTVYDAIYNLMRIPSSEDIYDVTYYLLK